MQFGGRGAEKQKLGQERKNTDAASADRALRRGRQGVVPAPRDARGIRDPVDSCGQLAASTRPESAQQRPREAGERVRKVRGTYWGPSARRRWGSPPAGEGRGSPGRPGGPGSSRTGQWSRPWLRGTPLGHSP